ncbi:hypothetical protein N9Y26_01135 [bacterium]|nr:hypothetical protein [bacterium]
MCFDYQQNHWALVFFRFIPFDVATKQFFFQVNVIVDGLSEQQDGKFKASLQFQKIKLQASIFVKFGIEHENKFVIAYPLVRFQR